MTQWSAPRPPLHSSHSIRTGFALNTGGRTPHRESPNQGDLEICHDIINRVRSVGRDIVWPTVAEHHNPWSSRACPHRTGLKGIALPRLQSHLPEKSMPVTRKALPARAGTCFHLAAPFAVPAKCLARWRLSFPVGERGHRPCRWPRFEPAHATRQKGPWPHSTLGSQS